MIEPLGAAIGGLVHAIAHALWSLVFEGVRYFREDRFFERLLGIRRALPWQQSSVPFSIITAKVSIGEPLEPTAVNYPGTTGYGELQCLIRLSPWFQRIYGRRRVQVYLSGSPSAHDLSDRDWILLGGPIYNLEVANLLEREEIRTWLPLSIRAGTEQEGGGSVIIEGGTVHNGTIRDGRVEKDVAVLIKVPNPEDRSKVLLFLVGSRTHGVEYAGRLMTDPLLLRELVAKVGRRCFYTVVPLKVNWKAQAREPSHIEALGPRTGNPRFLNTD